MIHEDDRHRFDGTRFSWQKTEGAPTWPPLTPAEFLGSLRTPWDAMPGSAHMPRHLDAIARIAKEDPDFLQIIFFGIPGSGKSTVMSNATAYLLEEYPFMKDRLGLYQHKSAMKKVAADRKPGEPFSDVQYMNAYEYLMTQRKKSMRRKEIGVWEMPGIGARRGGFFLFNAIREYPQRSHLFFVIANPVLRVQNDVGRLFEHTDDAETALRRQGVLLDEPLQPGQELPGMKDPVILKRVKTDMAEYFSRIGPRILPIPADRLPDNYYGDTVNQYIFMKRHWINWIIGELGVPEEQVTVVETTRPKRYITLYQGVMRRLERIR